MRPRVPADRDQLLAAILTEPRAAAFRSLSPYDQAHLCRVVHLLQHQGVDDPDLLTAGLLHDLGKAGVEGRVRLIDRVARVLLRRGSPRLLHHWGQLPAPRWRRGLAVAEHHAALGAEHAARLGCSARTCWLIRYHEDAAMGERYPELALLAAADRAAE